MTTVSPDPVRVARVVVDEARCLERLEVLVLAWIDAFDGTPVLDRKPELPRTDRVMSAEEP